MTKSKKIDVVASVTGAFSFLRHNLWLVLRLYWFPLLVGFVAIFGTWITLIEYVIEPFVDSGEFGEGDASPYIGVIQPFLIMPLTAIAANIALTFFVAIPMTPLAKYMVNKSAVSRFPIYFTVNRNVMAVWGALAIQVLFIMLIQVSLLASQIGILFLPAFGDLSVSSEVAIIIAVGLILLLILAVRLSILPVVTAIEGRIRLVETWRLTRGNGLRLVACFVLWYAMFYAVLLGLCGSIFVVGLVVYAIAAALSVATFVSPVLIILGFAFMCLSFLILFAASQAALGALIYRHLAEFADETATPAIS
jgi:hypothetical protein